MKCPKCGSEMEYAIDKEGTIAEGIEEWYCRKCGHCEDGEAMKCSLTIKKRKARSDPEFDVYCPYCHRVFEMVLEEGLFVKVREVDRDRWQGKSKPETEPMLRIEDITPAWIHDHMKELSLKHVEFVTKEVEKP